MTEYQEIPLSKIREPEVAVRTGADEDAFLELVYSIDQHGLIQPIKVRPVGEKFEVVVGHRRFLACRSLGHETIAATIEEMSDYEVAFVRLEENAKRENVSPLDEASHFRYLIDTFELTQQQVGEAIGKSHAYVSLRLKLMTLPLDLKEAVTHRQISPEIALQLMKIPDAGTRGYYLQYCVEGGATTAMVKRWVSDWIQSQVLNPEPMAVKQQLAAEKEATKSAWLCHFCGVEGHVAYLHNVWVCDEELALWQDFRRAYHQEEPVPAD